MWAAPRQLVFLPEVSPMHIGVALSRGALSFSSLSALLLLSSCSVTANEDEGTSGPGAGTSPRLPTPSGNSGGAIGAPNPGGVGGFSSGSATSLPSSPSCMPQPDDAGCVGEQYAGETVPLDVYVLFDQSCSMSCPISLGGPGRCCMGDPNARILPVRQAMAAFLRDPRSAGIGLGLGYFGQRPLGQASCRPTDYETPDLPIGDAQAEALIASLEVAQPTGETPTGAALRGACTYIDRARSERPGRSVALLLVTDGIPETPLTNCGATLTDAVAAARECSSRPVPIKTYVLGIGQALSNLDQIAAAGGTQEAYLVEGGDVARMMLEALNAIRGKASIPCQLEIPPAPSGRDLDTQEVNLGLCDADGNAQSTLYVGSSSDCSSTGGWYYDDPANPRQILLCPTSCAIASTPGAQLYYSVGCQTQVPIR
ncbi:MAG TPA: vWA domain-containing protein [Polyangiaceae bacterium]|nr:vWA domain-containing protein [Polyangiaceae bacterium]